LKDLSPETNALWISLGTAPSIGQMDNGLLFHMTQPTSRSSTRSHYTKQTNH